MLIIDNDHILSANRKCLITEQVTDSPGRPGEIAGIRVTLNEDGNHIIYDGTHTFFGGSKKHRVKEVLFVPSVAWAEALVGDPELYAEAEQAVRAVRTYPGVDVTTFGFLWGCPNTLRKAIDDFQARGPRELHAR